MSFFVLKFFFYAQRTKGNALINFYIFTNHTSLSNYNSSSVVYKK